VQWPRTAEPNKREWNIWKTILSRAILVNGLHIPNIGCAINPTVENLTVPNNPAPLQTLSQIHSQLSALHETLLGTVHFPLDEGKAIIDGIRSGQCLAASDGSVMDNTMASYAVKLNLRDDIKNNSNINSISAVGGVDGGPGHISSLRAESRGAIAILLLIHIVCKKWIEPLETVRDLTLIFDSDTVVTRSKADPNHRNDFLSMDYDLWVERNRILQQIPIKIQFQWIASHQDSHNSNTPLSNAASLNIQVDHMA
jgi:hypothetical protein